MAKRDNIPKTDLSEIEALIERLKRLIFGPSSDKRAVTGSSTEEDCAAPDTDSEQQITQQSKGKNEQKKSFCDDIHSGPLPADFRLFQR